MRATSKRTAGSIATLNLLVALILTSCSDAPPTAREEAAEPTPSIPTLTALPPPPREPPTGELSAQMRQSSIDAALGRMQVWVENDKAEEIDPRRITYLDARLGVDLPGDRLRLIPSQSERGYPLYFPEVPRCERPEQQGGRVEVLLGGQTVTLPVDDPAEVVERFVISRCQELTVAEVADLSWAEEVPADVPGEDSTGTLTLIVRPTGEADRELVIDSISGTFLFSSVGGAAWEPDVTVAGDGAAQRIELDVRPARCDPHAFVEGGGATAFKIRLLVDGEPGQILLRMSPSGQRSAILYAKASCGLE